MAQLHKKIPVLAMYRNRPKSEWVAGHVSREITDRERVIAEVGLDVTQVISASLVKRGGRFRSSAAWNSGYYVWQIVMRPT